MLDHVVEKFRDNIQVILFAYDKPKAYTNRKNRNRLGVYVQEIMFRLKRRMSISLVWRNAGKNPVMEVLCNTDCTNRQIYNQKTQCVLVLFVHHDKIQDISVD